MLSFGFDGMQDGGGGGVGVGVSVSPHEVIIMVWCFTRLTGLLCERVLV